MNDPKPLESRASRWFIPVVLFLGTLLLIGVTLKDYGVTWDEPPYFHASDLHVRWISGFSANIVTGELRNSLDDQAIRAAWHWNPYNVPHPPFSRIVSGFAKEISSPFLDKFSAYRMGPALLFAVLVTVIYLWIKELFGAATGLFSALAVILTPNLFGFAHIAVTDLPLAAMWFLTAYSFWKGLSNWKWSVVLGIVWGLALATKFPAALIPIPLILWAHIFHRDKYVNNVFALLFLAPVVMIATQPYLWHQTGLRVLEFLYEGISRAYRPDANFPIYFFDQLYTTKQLPWYYSFLIIGITTPEPLLALAFIGLGSIPWSKQRSATLLFLGNTAFVLLMGLLPGAVLHDGVRQMLSALPFLAGLASAGFYVLTTSLLNLARGTTRFQQIANLRAKIIATWFLVLCFSPALDLYLCHPFQLSFYNRLVGGVRGAYERGLETTYFMEAFTPSFLQTLNERIPKNATINASFASFMLDYYQKEGRLRRDLKITNEKPSNYYVLLNRRSTLSPQERNLINGKSEPYVAVTIAGVPLVSVFEFEKGD
ncbi:MAG: phospholipid carrier-dependent glycosyltransferase [Deltaproteobacteria bacterium]|nr:MAG: phospholipid carrier-dependent glycosyltransferase [Deltaproteobacteria bacterium]